MQLLELLKLLTLHPGAWAPAPILSRPAERSDVCLGHTLVQPAGSCSAGTAASRRAGAHRAPRSPPEAHSAASARSGTRSSLGPGSDENERICQMVCHELSLLALGVSYSQALKWWKLPKDADFLSTWASPEKNVLIVFQANFTTNFNLWPERTREFSYRPSRWMLNIHSSPGLYSHAYSLLHPYNTPFHILNKYFFFKKSGQIP